MSPNKSERTRDRQSPSSLAFAGDLVIKSARIIEDRARHHLSCRQAKTLHLTAEALGETGNRLQAIESAAGKRSIPPQTASSPRDSQGAVVKPALNLTPILSRLLTAQAGGRALRGIDLGTHTPAESKVLEELGD